MPKSQDHIDELASLIPGAIFVGRRSVDGQMSIPYMSQALRDLFELSQDDVCEDATPLIQRIHPDDFEAFSDSIDESVRNLTTWECEIRFILPKQGLRWRHGIAHTRRTDNGEVFWYGYISDTTDRKKSEEIRFEDETRYRRLFAAVHDAIIVINCVTLKIIDVNSAAESLYGYPREQMIGMDCIVLSAEPDKSRQFFSEHQERVSMRLHRKMDGTVFPVEVTAGYYNYRNQEISVNVIRDNTERCRILDEITRSETRFSTVFHSNPLPISVTETATGLFIDVNDAFLNMFGYGRSEVIGHTSAELNIWDHPEDRQRLLEIVRTTGRVHNFEAVTCNKTGKKIVVTISVEPIELGGTPCLLIMVSDVTARKQAEKILIESHDALERQVLSRTMSLQSVNKQLSEEIEAGCRRQQKLLEYQHRMESLSLQLALSEERERGRIAGELHDQVSQDLIVAKMRLAALNEQSIESHVALAVEEIERSLDRALKDIRSLTFQLRPPILANAGLESAVGWLCEEFTRDFGLEFSTRDDFQPKSLPYEIRSIVFQAVRELLMNIVKHARASHVQVCLKRVEDSLCIHVIDDGVGIPSLASAGGAGFREGFGLFHTRQKIESLGGHFCMESEPGQGTRVTLGVPLKSTQALQEAAI